MAGGAMASEAAANIAKAKALVATARQALVAGQGGDIMIPLHNAERLARDLPAAESEALVAQSRAIAQKAAKVRSIESFMDADVRAAMTAPDHNTRGMATAIARLTERLGRDETRQYLPTAKAREYKAAIEAAKSRLARTNKQDAISRAGDLVNQLEERLVEDPFKGKLKADVYRADRDINYITDRAPGWLKDLPAADADADADAKVLRDRVAGNLDRHSNPLVRLRPNADPVITGPRVPFRGQRAALRSHDAAGRRRLHRRVC